MSDAPLSVFYGCDQCGREFAVATEAEIPAGNLCSTLCRNAAEDEADRAAAAAESEG